MKSMVSPLPPIPELYEKEDSDWIPTDWTFKNNGVAKRFDDHVRETLPWYDLATHGVAHLASAYLPQDGLAYDIGASTGNIGRALSDIIKSRNIEFIGIEAAPEMAELYDAPGELVVGDATTYEYGMFDVAVLFLVLMFLPVATRMNYIDRLIAHTKPGGAIIVIDKNHQPYGYLGSTIHRWTMKQKRLGNISYDEIAQKELSLVGGQRPIEHDELITRGFHHWLRIGEFSGYIYLGKETS